MFAVILWNLHDEISQRLWWINNPAFICSFASFIDFKQSKLEKLNNIMDGLDHNYPPWLILIVKSHGDSQWLSEFGRDASQESTTLEAVQKMKTTLSTRVWLKQCLQTLSLTL